MNFDNNIAKTVGNYSSDIIATLATPSSTGGNFKIVSYTASMYYKNPKLSFMVWSLSIVDHHPQTLIIKIDSYATVQMNWMGIIGDLSSSVS